MTQSQLAFQAQAGEFLRNYKPRPNLNLLINAFIPSRIAFHYWSSANVVTIIQFPDVSFYQGDIDFVMMATKTRAIILRAGQNVWIDPKFEDNYWKAKELGLLVGVYWFFDDRASPGEQAEKLRQALEGKTLELEIFIDWENSYGGQFKGLGNVVAMMQRVESFTGLEYKEIGMYTGYYWFRSNSNPITNAGQYNYLKSKPLWEAWYTTTPANVLIPAPWGQLTHWQFGTPAVDWGQQSQEIDMNYFNGTEQEFSERYGVPQPPTGDAVIYKTTTDAKLWKNPDGTAQIGTIRSGTQVTGDSPTTSEFVRLTIPPGYTKKSWLQQVTVPPPPPPPPPPTNVTHVISIYADGKISIDNGTPF